MANITFDDGREFDFNEESKKALEEIDIRTKKLIVELLDKHCEQNNIKEFILTMYSLQFIAKEAIQSAIDEDWESVKKAIVD